MGNETEQKQPWGIIVCAPIVLTCPVGHRWPINVQIARDTSNVCPQCYRKCIVTWSKEGIPSVVDNGVHINTPKKPGIIQP